MTLEVKELRLRKASQRPHTDSSHRVMEDLEPILGTLSTRCEHTLDGLPVDHRPPRIHIIHSHFGYAKLPHSTYWHVFGEVGRNWHVQYCAKILL